MLCETPFASRVYIHIYIHMNLYVDIYTYICVNTYEYMYIYVKMHSSWAFNVEHQDFKLGVGVRLPKWNVVRLHSEPLDVEKKGTLSAVSEPDTVKRPQWTA